MFSYPLGRDKNVMSLRIFVSIFLSNKSSMEQYKGLKDEQNLIKLFILNSKDNYQNKIKKCNLADGHAWRQHAVRPESPKHIGNVRYGCFVNSASLSSIELKFCCFTCNY
jgi:hypothetical protein